MTRALELAARARGKTSPNPMVGAVLVRNGKVVAEGYHRKAGTDHAEVVALKKAGAKARGATAYVTLEPCCHTGSTGPCTDALIRAGVKRVVLASIDPNPVVSGKGARRLRRAGVKVERGLLRQEAERLNEAYYQFQRTGRPFVTLKMAQTLDGRIATTTGDSQWISGGQALKVAHQLRAENDVVLVGRGTVTADDPALTVRRVKGVNPYRVIVSSSGKIPTTCQLVRNNQDLKTIIATTPRTAERLSHRRGFGPMTYWELKADRYGRLDPREIVKKAAEFGLQSLLIEGGSELATSFLKARQVDKCAVIIAPMILGRGTEAVGDLKIRKLADSLKLERMSVSQAGPDLVVTGYPRNEE